MTYVAGIVHTFGQFVDYIEIFRISFPLPNNTLQHGVARNIFRSLQVAEDIVDFFLPAGR